MKQGPRVRVFALLVVTVLLAVSPAAAWVLDLPAAIELEGTDVTLGAVTGGAVPEPAANLVLVSAGRPGRTYSLSRAKILRRLTSDHMASGVVLRGAKTCRVTLVGRAVDGSELERAIIAKLQPWLPPTAEGGPAAKLSIIGSLPHVATDGRWSVSLTQPRRLRPGRNLVALRIDGGTTATRCTATVDCLVFDEVPHARRAIAPGEAMNEDLFRWEWQSLDSIDQGVVVGRDAIRGMALAHAVAEGDPLRVTDIRRPALVHGGERVDLILKRGAIEVTLRGVARQNGAAGQMISVKNETNGRLVSAEVIGPGRVAWRR